MRIGVFGGTFNPIHNAHVQTARIALDALSLDRILFMVAADPPHKRVAGQIPAATRLRMTALAAETLPGAKACDLELKREGKSFTADTLAALTALYPGAELYLIVGSDMLLDLPTWYHPERIASLCRIACIPRRGQDGTDRAAAEQLRSTLGVKIEFLPDGADELSSTEIRARFFDGRPTEGLLPEPVARYCYETGLYFPEETRRLQQRVRPALTEKRFLHTMGCVRTAAVLAAQWGADPEKARAAALLHDCAKKLDDAVLSVLAGDDTDVSSVWHAFAGAVLAKTVYGVSDDEVLRAVRLHSTGDAGMTALDAVVFYADLIEPGRTYSSAELLRAAAADGMRAAMLLGLTRTRAFVSEKGGTFHPASLRAIDWFASEQRSAYEQDHT